MWLSWTVAAGRNAQCTCLVNGSCTVRLIVFTVAKTSPFNLRNLLVMAKPYSRRIPKTIAPVDGRCQFHRSSRLRFLPQLLFERLLKVACKVGVEAELSSKKTACKLVALEFWWFLLSSAYCLEQLSSWRHGGLYTDVGVGFLKDPEMVL